MDTRQLTLDEIMEGADFIEYLSYDSEAEYMADFKDMTRNSLIRDGYRGDELEREFQEMVDAEQKLLDERRERLPWGEARKMDEHE